MMMSPTALIDTAGSGALPGAPGEVDNGAPDGGGGVCPVAADVPLCPPAVVHAAGSNIRVSSADTRRQRGGRLAGAGRRAASMLVLWAWPRVARHGSGQNMRPVLLPAPTPLRHPDCPSTAAGAKERNAVDPRGGRWLRGAWDVSSAGNMHLPRRSPRHGLTPASPARSVTCWTTRRWS